MSTNPQRPAVGAERGFARNPIPSEPADRHPADRHPASLDLWWLGFSNWMRRRRIPYRKYCCGGGTFATRRRLLRWLTDHRTNEPK